MALTGWKKRVRDLIVMVVVTALLDVGVAQILKYYGKKWGPVAQEQAYREASPIFHHTLKANQDTTGYWFGHPFPVKTNSLAFKDRTVREVPLEGNKKRVLFIGDSFTEGVGYPYEKTFVGLCDEAWAARGIETLNAAVSGYSPSTYYRKLKYLVEEKRLAFDRVIAVIDISDTWDEVFRYQWNGEQLEEVPGGVELPQGVQLRVALGDNSLILTLVHAVNLQRRWKENPLADMLDTRMSTWTYDDAAWKDYGEKDRKSVV